VGDDRTAVRLACDEDSGWDRTVARHVVEPE
jgi:hypothetical protein